MKNLNRIHFLVLGIWFILNLLQSIFTGLHSDESYYWMYAQHPDWGYFDHPPMVALLIFIGSSILPGEIGVRLLFILISTLTLALILNELKDGKNLRFLFVFVFSFPLIHTHIAGFLAIPDIPLMFFTILFLLAYREFLTRQNWQTMLALGLIIPAMIYSKYHAFLIIGFTLFSNISLLKNKYFYGIVILSILMLIPHILWQIENEFPTFKYHLVERAKPIQLKYLLPYLAGIVAVTGPFSGFIVLRKLLKVKPENHFERALVFNISGFILLFLVMSFKNRIEIHWLSAIIPMIIFLTYPLIKENKKTKLWFTRLAIPVILLLVLFRVYIAFDIIPNVGNLKITFYNRQKSAFEIKEMAQGRKVGFFNNYAATSNYIFYTRDQAIHLSTPTYRFCQYDLWDDEKSARNQDIFAIQHKSLNSPDLVNISTGEQKGIVAINQFQPLTGLDITITSILKNQEYLEIVCTLTNTNDFIISTLHNSEPVLAVMCNKAEIASFPLSISSEPEEIKPQSNATIRCLIPRHLIQDNYKLQIYTRSKENIRGQIKSVELP
ncbi:MAG: ArnT family glycosyltransferase [Draconibacterium sp.]